MSDDCHCLYPQFMKLKYIKKILYNPNQKKRNKNDIQVK